MPYPKTLKAMAEALIEHTELRDILEVYADELQEQEPYATNTIRTLRDAARTVDALEDDQ